MKKDVSSSWRVKMKDDALTFIHRSRELTYLTGQAFNHFNTEQLHLNGSITIGLLATPVLMDFTTLLTLI